jgi:hypothetical protein
LWFRTGVLFGVVVWYVVAGYVDWPVVLVVQDGCGVAYGDAFLFDA